MSDLTFLLALSFLVVAYSYVALRCAQAANDISAGIVTGFVQGTPVSPRAREGMLFGMWLNYEVSIVTLAAFLAIATLEMADHVTGAGVRLLVHLITFLAASMCGLVLMQASFAFVRYRRKLRRIMLGQAQAELPTRRRGV